jgi:16S rRNA (guanine527-N7)-methyltransferase
MLMQNVEEYLENQLNNIELTQYLEYFSKYLSCLIQWNKAYNLTAVRDPITIIDRHFIESLTITPWLYGNTWLDLGTGPGFPGLPLAIINPTKKIFLLDSNIKKINFLREIKRQLQLEHVTVIHSRATDFLPNIYFDTVMSRALCSLSQFVAWSEHCIASSGIWLAMKGKTPTDELQQLTKERPDIIYNVFDTRKVQNGAERCVIIMQRTDRHE